MECENKDALPSTTAILKLQEGKSNTLMAKL